MLSKTQVAKNVVDQIGKLRLIEEEPHKIKEQLLKVVEDNFTEVIASCENKIKEMGYGITGLKVAYCSLEEQNRYLGTRNAELKIQLTELKEGNK